MAYVLIIDDSEFALEFIAEMLVEANYKVVATTDPVEFMRLVKEEPTPDLLIVDSVMPEIQGPELIAQIRALPDKRLANIPVILASALENQSPPDEAVLLLPKPFGPEELEQALNLVLG
ncbi:MAG: response regulator [Chloroflexota bacterium]